MTSGGSPDKTHHRPPRQFDHSRLHQTVTGQRMGRGYGVAAHTPAFAAVIGDEKPDHCIAETAGGESVMGRRQQQSAA